MRLDRRRAGLPCWLWLLGCNGPAGGGRGRRHLPSAATCRPVSAGAIGDLGGGSGRRLKLHLTGAVTLPCRRTAVLLLMHRWRRGQSPILRRCSAAFPRHARVSVLRAVAGLSRRRRPACARRRCC